MAYLSARHLVFNCVYACLPVLGVCFVIVDLLSELCIFATRGAVPSVSVCCVCPVSILTAGLHANASANEHSVNNRPISNSLLTASGMGSVRLQPIRVQELS